jgi:hypothetical protein
VKRPLKRTALRRASADERKASAGWQASTDSAYWGMSWTTHYFDFGLNRDIVSRSCATKEDSLRLACDLMRRDCRVHYILGPENEKVHAVEINRWCKAHPSRDRRPPLK